MALRSRIIVLGAVGVVVIAGILCAILVTGIEGEILTIALLSLGLAGAVLLVFLEIGLGEERDLAKQQERRVAREHGRLLSGRRRLSPRRHRRRPS
jgi:hypothetical protein